MKMKKISAAVLMTFVVVAVGCSQQPSEPVAGNSPSEAAAVPAGPVAHLTQVDIRVIAPAPAAEGQVAAYHTIGVDSVGAITPLSDAEPFTALIGSGDHDITPTQEGCQFAIEVEVKNEKDATAVPAVLKLASNEQNSVMLPGGELEERRVTVHMAADAKNNYSCNVMLRKRL